MSVVRYCRSDGLKTVIINEVVVSSKTRPNYIVLVVTRQPHLVNKLDNAEKCTVRYSAGSSLGKGISLFALNTVFVHEPYNNLTRA